MQGFCILAQKSGRKMKGKSPNQDQLNLFKPILKQIINPGHELVILADKYPWAELEKEFSVLYSNTGAPAKPIRLMVGLLLLKQMFNYGDETIVQAWVQNPYYQYFCGEVEFQWEYPCDPSDLVHFRKRIDKQGVEKIFLYSVRIQGKRSLNKKDLLVDTTAHEKNITFPTDVKLYRRIVEKCNKIAKKEGIELRQSYTRTIKRLMLQQRFSHHPRRRKQANKAKRKLRTVAGRITRDLERKLNANQRLLYDDQIIIFKKVLSQKRNDRNKIYSLHEPEVSCIAKGKAHKPYEFGSKASFALLPKSNIIVGVVNYPGNPHDSQTLEDTLQHAEKITERKFDNVIVDRAYKGKKKIGDTQIIIPGKKAKTISQQQRMRRKCRSRAAIEPIIGHIKYDCRMLKSYLKGTKGDEINALLAASAFNMRQLLRKIREEINFAVFQVLQFFEIQNILCLNLS